jgi:hypothetical protein
VVRRTRKPLRSVAFMDPSLWLNEQFRAKGVRGDSQSGSNCQDRLGRLNECRICPQG